MHDDYGRLIKAEKGPIGSLREGGDNLGGRPLAVVPTQTVALFSGLVKVGAGGMAQVPLDIPDFNGELRLMAVAMSDKKVGHADRPLTVRDPVVADIVLPRFLAPGDKAEAALNINNVEGASGSLYRDRHDVRPRRSRCRRAAGRADAQRSRAASACCCPVVLDGKGLGIANITLTLTGPGGFNVSARLADRSARAATRYRARRRCRARCRAELHRRASRWSPIVVPSTRQRRAQRFGRAWLQRCAGPAALARQISLMAASSRRRAAPCRCCISTISPISRACRRIRRCTQRIQDSVDTVLDMQNFAGNFGMWGPGRDADPWLSRLRARFPRSGEDRRAMSCRTKR